MRTLYSQFLLNQTYKIGQTIKFTNKEELYKDWPKEDDIFNIEKEGKLIARVEVQHITKDFVYGVIINTYGHKRQKQ